MKITITIYAQSWIQVITHIKQLLKSMLTMNGKTVENNGVITMRSKKDYGTLIMTIGPDSKADQRCELFNDMMASDDTPEMDDLIDLEGRTDFANQIIAREKNKSSLHKLFDYA